MTKQLPAELNDIDSIFKFWVDTPSNMQREIMMINKYAKLCDHITEFGFGLGRSAASIMVTRPKTFISYDIRDYGPRKLFEEIALKENVNFKFILGDTSKVEIEPTEMIFIDSWHTFEHKELEFKLHCKNVSKYILLHDTRTCGNKGEDGSTPGFIQAIRNFLEREKNWYVKEIQYDGNGITVLSCLNKKEAIPLSDLR